jgi:CRISPR-associated protein Csx14
MSIQVAVDPANPGQFFACCGLLELSGRLFGEAEGCFAGGNFQVTCSGHLGEILRSLVERDPEEVTILENGLNVKPLIAPLRLRLGANGATLTLDRWMTLTVEKNRVVSAANPPWNFWSGQQTSFWIWRDLRLASERQLADIGLPVPEDLFERRIMLSGRFGFDPGAAWNALDVGFSPNEQGMEVASSAIVELLAAVGIQRFQPRGSADRQSFDYATWGLPLAPTVASAAASCAISAPPTCHFHCSVVSRGSYAALSRSVPTKGDTHE